jgi:hypothetical protein
LVAASRQHVRFSLRAERPDRYIPREAGTYVLPAIVELGPGDSAVRRRLGGADMVQLQTPGLRQELNKWLHDPRGRAS